MGALRMRKLTHMQERETWEETLLFTGNGPGDAISLGGPSLRLLRPWVHHSVGVTGRQHLGSALEHFHGQLGKVSDIFQWKRGGSLPIMWSLEVCSMLGARSERKTSRSSSNSRISDLCRYCSCFHLFNKYLLSNYHVLGHILEASENEIDMIVEFFIWLGTGRWTLNTDINTNK